MDDFKDQVRKGFNKCKLDIDVIASENSELKSQIDTLKSENYNLKEDISCLKNEMSELKAELKGINIALNYIKEFNSSMNSQSAQKPQENMNFPSTQIREENITSQQITPRTQQIRPQTQKDSYEALLEFKARVNKREILKQKLISMITENGIHLSELKFLFVDHYRYCSKATFYSYLKELEFEKILQVERENSKNYVYLKNMLKREV